MNEKQPQSSKRDRTRTKLITAAAEEIGEKGWDRTSLEDVAARAGMTRGAIYGNFKSRDDLFLAVVQAHWKPAIPASTEGLTLKQYLRKVGEMVAAGSDRTRVRTMAALSFYVYALTHEEMRKRVVHLNGELYSRGAERLRGAFPPGEFRIPPEALMCTLHALSDGLTFLRTLTPELITADTVVRVFESLA
jgi:AcrR family transcriptional regulator